MFRQVARLTQMETALKRQQLGLHLAADKLRHAVDDLRRGNVTLAAEQEFARATYELRELFDRTRAIRQEQAAQSAGAQAELEVVGTPELPLILGAERDVDELLSRKLD